MIRSLFMWLLPVSVMTTGARGAGPDFESKYQAIGFSRGAPRFMWFAVDSLGRGRVGQNPISEETDAAGALRFDARESGRFAYVQRGVEGKEELAWAIDAEERAITLRSEFVPGAPIPPFVLAFDQKANHATLLGMMAPGERRMSLPCVLHMPDMGTMRITCDAPGAEIDYDARRRVQTPFVRVAFPAATAARPKIAYRLEVVSIYPAMPGIEGQPLYDGFRRDFLNIFQVNPRVGMLANNASSDPVTFTVFKYAEVARHAPPLAEGLTCLDLVRMTLDRYLSGALGYGQKGYAMAPTDADLIPWPTPWTTTDSLPSLIIAACAYADGAKDPGWARKNYGRLDAWAREMMAPDADDDGLIEYPATGNYGDRPARDKRPSNWWDTINFGHEDAYSNALAYHACREWAALARKLGHEPDATWAEGRAEKLRASYVAGFLNPETGVLAGWRSADGQLHDYWFTFVNGVAIAYGLVDEATGNAIMDRLFQKMAEVGYTNFSLGLPGNLVPIRKGDYVHHDTPPEKFGEPQREDGSDGFQFYENGGTTGCYAYFTVKALYRLGRIADARRILYPMLDGYARGEFQGFGENGMSRDWRDWKGGCHGYEGLLVDNYFALLAVLDDAAMRPNIVFIMADDLGYNDLSCQGAAKIRTPGIDRLAKEGIRLTDAHTPSGLCCPSRYGVLTGRYPWRRKQTCWASPGAGLLIEPGRETTASLLKKAGYTCGIVGKWHLGFGDATRPFDWNGDLKPGPLEVGFDYAFVDIANRTGCYVENHRIVGLDPADPIRHEGRKRVGGRAAFSMVNEENARVLHEKAVAFLELHAGGGAGPFYLHYVPNNIHTPLTPNPRFKGKNQCGKYGDFVAELDWSVGDILTTLDRLRLADRTLVIFTSDNGGVYENEGFGAGHRSCAPFNGQKGDVWEGGNRVPFLARWPGHIRAGTTSDRMLCLTDMLATFATLTGQSLAAQAGPDSLDALPILLGREGATDGRTNLIMQSGSSSLFERRKEGLWAVREANWKLVLGRGSGYSTVQGAERNPYLRFAEVGMVNSDYLPDGKLKPDAPPMQLYDLDSDAGERCNVFRERPEVVDRLMALFEKLRESGCSRR
ncbi:MAG TPA: sulfatase-like hydrolase/transferase [Verrucomicrobiae bacterium]|nr:sulfatase-like hydrolase/transferase [Verrucomicrobiae bacterium]